MRLVEQAVRARGVPAAAAVGVAARVRGTIKDAEGGGDPYPFVSVDTSDDGRYWTELLPTVNGRRVRKLAGSDGVRHWASRDGVFVPLGPSDLALEGDTAYLKEASRLRALTDRKRFRLEAIPGADVGGRACTGVRVRSEGRPDLDLYLDAETHLLRKCAYDKLCADGKRQPFVSTLSDYKEFGGVKIPVKTHITVGGDAGSIEMVVASVEFVPLAQVEHLFKKPE